MTKILEPFGPVYPAMKSLDKYRRISREQLTPAQCAAYSEALGKAILGMQRSALQRELPGHNSPSASRTWHNNADGSIGQAIREQQRSALQSYVARVRRERMPVEWKRLYKAAMKAKRAKGAVYLR
jgi:hypothetical protein